MQLDVNIYYKFLWNHFVIQQRVFNRLKVTYSLASSMSNSEDLWNIWIFRKNEKTDSQTTKLFCELRTANSNPVYFETAANSIGITANKHLLTETGN